MVAVGHGVPASGKPEISADRDDPPPARYAALSARGSAAQRPLLGVHVAQDKLLSLAERGGLQRSGSLAQPPSASRYGSARAAHPVPRRGAKAAGSQRYARAVNVAPSVCQVTSTLVGGRKQRRSEKVPRG